MRYLLYILLFSISLLSKPNNTFHQMQKEYNAAVSQALYSLKIDKYLILADKGHSLAQYDLGVIYEEGHYPVNINLQKAVKYYQAASKNNHIPSLVKIAYFYQKGIILKKNTKKAIELYSKAAKENNAQAQYKLASMYAREEGLKKDIDIILSLYTKSANQGYLSSIIALGLYYEIGIEVKKDYGKALYWFSKVKDIPTIPQRIRNICNKKSELCK